MGVTVQKEDQASEATKPQSTKLTINVSPEVHAELKAMARSRGITVTELVRRAVALDKFVHDHPNGQLLMKEGDEIQQVVLVG